LIYSEELSDKAEALKRENKSKIIKAVKHLKNY
jgi:hypothetical protein